MDILSKGNIIQLVTDKGSYYPRFIAEEIEVWRDQVTSMELGNYLIVESFIFYHCLWNLEGIKNKRYN